MEKQVLQDKSALCDYIHPSGFQVELSKANEWHT